jgi:hypothetical protein
MHSKAFKADDTLDAASTSPSLTKALPVLPLPPLQLPSRARSKNKQQQAQQGLQSNDP